MSASTDSHSFQESQLDKPVLSAGEYIIYLGVHLVTQRTK